VIEVSCEALFGIIENALTSIGLQVSQCIGFGSDSASNMVGEHNSVWSRIKERSPNCILFRCICHSLAKCVEEAFGVLPCQLGFLMSEVSQWFSKSYSIT